MKLQKHLIFFAGYLLSALTCLAHAETIWSGQFSASGTTSSSLGIHQGLFVFKGSDSLSIPNWRGVGTSNGTLAGTKLELAMSWPAVCMDPIDVGDVTYIGFKDDFTPCNIYALKSTGFRTTPLISDVTFTSSFRANNSLYVAGYHWSDGPLTTISQCSSVGCPTVFTLPGFAQIVSASTSKILASMSNASGTDSALYEYDVANKSLGTPTTLKDVHARYWKVYNDQFALAYDIESATVGGLSGRSHYTLTLVDLLNKRKIATWGFDSNIEYSYGSFAVVIPVDGHFLVWLPIAGGGLKLIKASTEGILISPEDTTPQGGRLWAPQLFPMTGKYRAVITATAKNLLTSYGNVYFLTSDNKIILQTHLYDRFTDFVPIAGTQEFVGCYDKACKVLSSDGTDRFSFTTTSSPIVAADKRFVYSEWTSNEKYPALTRIDALAYDLCLSDPLKISPGVCGCGITELDSDNDGLPNCKDLCPADRYKTAPGTCGCGVSESDSDKDGTPSCIDVCPEDPLKITKGTCGCGIPDTDSDRDGTADCVDQCPNDPTKTAPEYCGCGVAETDSDRDGTPNCIDLCAADPAKVTMGVCGCNVPDVDSDRDGTFDCKDSCPNDSTKKSPGACGCGNSDADSDHDGSANCLDACPFDTQKVAAGICGCNVSETDTDKDGRPDCVDQCPSDPNKTSYGTCGCGQPDADTDNDGKLDCSEFCPNDPLKLYPGICGCGVQEIDSDRDGSYDCNDKCPNDKNKWSPGECGCGIADTDTDRDGVPDCKDLCPSDKSKSSPGQCGCAIADIDHDKDGIASCVDGCPSDSSKKAEGLCGCGVVDQDSDGDGSPDCVDLCIFSKLKTIPGVCGCVIADTDINKNGIIDCIEPTVTIKQAPILDVKKRSIIITIPQASRSNIVYQIEIVKKGSIKPISIRTKKLRVTQELKRGVYSVRYRERTSTVGTPWGEWSAQSEIKVR